MSDTDLPRYSHLPRAVIRVSGAFAPGDSLSLEGDEFKHLFKARRLGSGNLIEIYNSFSDKFYICRVENISQSSASLIIEEPFTPYPVPSLKIFCALPELQVADAIVEKCGEIGVSELYFFRSERSQGDLVRSIGSKRLARWQKIALSAFKQSGQRNLVKIYWESSLDFISEHFGQNPLPKEAYLLSTSKEVFHKPTSTSSPSKNLPDDFFPNNLGDLPAEQLSSKTVLENTRANADTYIIAGPEGGLSESEENRILGLGFIPSSLGPGILRVETAIVIAAGSIIGRKTFPPIS